jgi:hypothetical protein
MSKIYLVKTHNKTIFATTKKHLAKTYRAKYNRILSKWQRYYSQFEETTVGIQWIKKEYQEKYFERWYMLNRTPKCHIEEIECR